MKIIARWILKKELAEMAAKVEEARAVVNDYEALKIREEFRSSYEALATREGFLSAFINAVSNSRPNLAAGIDASMTVDKRTRVVIENAITLIDQLSARLKAD